MQYLNFHDLRSKLGNRSRSSVYRDVEAGRLPAPIKFGARLYWNEIEVETALSQLRAPQAGQRKSGGN